MATPGLNSLSSMVQSHDSDLSPTEVEMPLKAIVLMYDGEGPSRPPSPLSITSASASAMLKRLDADGYVSHEGRLGVVPNRERESRGRADASPAMLGGAPAGRSS